MGYIFIYNEKIEWGTYSITRSWRKKSKGLGGTPIILGLVRSEFRDLGFLNPSNFFKTLNGVSTDARQDALQEDFQKFTEGKINNSEKLKRSLVWGMMGNFK